MIKIHRIYEQTNFFVVINLNKYYKYCFNVAELYYYS